VSRAPALTSTSYAILGLLARRPWSTYELTQQMDRSLGRVWPRAVSKLYEEPKKLVAHGLARARQEPTGRRQRTVYSITPRGRRALARWLREPGEGPVLEFEQLVKVWLAENGTRQDTLATLDAVRDWAVERNAENLAAARAYASGEGPFQVRAAQNLLAGSFLTDFYAMVASWAQWATEQVGTWPDDPSEAVADAAAFSDVVRRASWSEPPSAGAGTGLVQRPTSGARGASARRGRP
jgi:PadR family transcriptional regulator, regulatory protein AphA